jgi:glycosyltransferase involved in cell wall biosynthesis
MQVLQVCPGSYVSGRGGVSEHVVNVAERLAANGHEVTVFATNPDGLPWHETVNGVHVRRFGRLAPGGAYFFSGDMALALSRARFDVVHAHGYHAFPMHAARIAKYKRFVITTHFHGAGHSVFRDCLFRLFRSYGGLTLRSADRIIAVSEFERRLLLGQYRLDADKVVVIPNGLDLKEFEGLTRRRSGLRSILYVGRLESYKGVQYLVEVLPQLPKDVVLEIVGRGSLRRFLEERAHKLGVADRVRFYQDLPRRELLQMYVDADVFVLLSRYEAYSLVVAEALTAKTPCIVANTSALTEWIDDRMCFGVDYPVRLDRLASLMEDVLNGGADGRNVGGRPRSKIVDWDEAVHRLEDVYAR